MKKLFLTSILLTSVLLGGITANATTSTNINTNQEILTLMPGMTIKEVDEMIKETATSLGKSEDEIATQILSELKTQQELTEKEKSKLTKGSRGGGSSTTTYTLGAAKYNGDVFYEPASTFSVQHGHVGIYWTPDTIVESMPGIGVRSKNRTSKKVEKGSKIFTFSGVSVAKQNVASNWAYNRIGDNYSYNFATNRTTSHYGDKNCSKLVWSAYKVSVNLDLDKDGGLGVYPKDILNHSKASVYKSY
ncbi:hypothetical protein [Clostridium baratii]|uniref:Cell wall-associated hydrolase n=1 Tax=Clostridium baratii TaxID=1561 RepID=A0A174TTB0_9CLOT|nr:hypothetical protein [Clostridium baratii]CUQ10710.1 Cell wall-associated hydrolase [Clostridium baratii]